MNKTEVAFTIARIKNLRLNGFGGACGAAAAKINNEIFEDKGKYVAGVNEFWLDKGHARGHVVVSFGGFFWDSGGLVESDDLLEWGMLDYDDPDYKTKGWSRKRAEKAILVQFDDKAEMMGAFPWDKPIPLG